MQTNRKSFRTLKSDRYIQVTVMDERPLWQVLLYKHCSYVAISVTRCQNFSVNSIFTIL